MTARELILAAVFDKAAGRRVFGYDSDTGKGAEVTRDGRALVHKAGVLEQRKAFGFIDRICIEGERGIPWQSIPREK